MYMCVITFFVTEGNTLVTKGLGNMKEDLDDQIKTNQSFSKLKKVGGKFSELPAGARIKEGPIGLRNSSIFNFISIE